MKTRTFVTTVWDSLTGETSVTTVVMPVRRCAEPEVLAQAIHFEVCKITEEDPEGWELQTAFFGSIGVGSTRFVGVWISQDGDTLTTYNTLEIAPAVAAAVVH
jgi:hypothetical protein